MLSSVKCLSESIEVTIWFLSFSLFICCIIFNDLCMLKQTCILGVIPARLCCMIICVLNFSFKNFLENVLICVHWGNWHVVCFFFLCLCQLCYLTVVGFAEWVCKCFIPFYLLEQLEEVLALLLQNLIFP